MTGARLIALALVAPAVAGCMAMPPKDLRPDAMAQFEAAVASIGCQMVGESDYLPVELQADLTREQVIQLLQFKLAADQAVRLPNGGIELKTGACA